MEFEYNLENPLPTSNDHEHENTFTNLFLNESDHIPSNKSPHRREIVSLIVHFSRKFDPFLSYLSVNYFDRFMSTHESIQDGKPWMSRLVVVSCISLALKMRKIDFSVMDIQDNDGSAFDSQKVERMEYLILGALKWRMRSITPFCFINFFVSLFILKDQAFKQALIARASEIIFTSQNEIKLLEFKPSLISASALLLASHELFPLQFQCYKKAILSCSYVDKENMSRCYNMMQEVVIDDYESTFDMESSTSTPVNVLDLHSLTTSSSDNEHSDITVDESNANPTINLERDLKRRRIGGRCRSDNTFQLSQIHRG